MAHSSAGRNWSLIRAHAFPTSHLLSTWTLRGGVTRSAISMGQVLTRFFSETAAFVKKPAHLKPIKYGLLPFGAYFKGWSGVSSQMLFSQTDRQTDRKSTTVTLSRMRAGPGVSFRGSTAITLCYNTEYSNYIMNNPTL